MLLPGREPVEAPRPSRPDPGDLFEEAFRTLRSNLLVRIREGDRAFLVTSAIPGEGKSTVAVNLAQVLAASNRKVLLIDADLRRPRNKLMDVPNREGLTDLLAGTVAPGAAYRHLGNGLTVLTSGSLLRDPQELLLGGNFERVVDLLKNDFDVLVFDSPPLLAFADATLLARRMDGVILVLKYGRVNTAEGHLVRKRLRSVQARLVCCVLTSVPDLYLQPYYPYANRYLRAKAPKARPDTRVIKYSLLAAVSLLMMVIAFWATSTSKPSSRAEASTAASLPRHAPPAAVASAPVLEVREAIATGPILPTGPITIEKLSVACGEADPCIMISTLGKGVHPRLSALSDPDRVVMDFPGAIFSSGVGRLQVGRGPIKAVRIGENAEQPPRARVVIDLTEKCDYEMQALANGVVLKVYRKAKARHAE